ncbi:hypothetical protein TVAG_300690 [Trichomonas vaginalis G3]|uniref:Alpha glucuronidase N-terminal domain-containing protein n=1 Tax=Trichomonas vaginalis (strain ATCC PRA-98 / G3) TaxID=412133 RepID=A2EP49_TRIV3|nr:hypothetical protein TVAG_300690 [Trichomonas vaginalis G3]|eukprot:XP_001317810.1 hypothetical protein [Trichomonas vaginalis G3]
MLSFLFLFISGKNITISKRGSTSSYTIYYPAAHPGEQPWWRFAAVELQAGIKNITGEVIPIETDAKEIKDKAILIGPTKFSKELTTLHFTDLRLDAFEIRFVKGEHLIINGGSRGTIYGVYELLETYAKFRFYTTWMEFYPSAEEFNVDSEVNISDIAGIQWRQIYGTDTILNFRHNVRKRANAGDQGLGYDTGGYLWSTFGVHTFWAQLPKSEYPPSQYPEMWALLPDGSRSSSAPCLTNKAAFDVILSKIIAEVDKDNTSSFIDVGHNDNMDYCHCPNCKALTEKYGNRYSGVLLDFCNRLSDAIKPKYPNHIIRMLAYYMTENPPFNIQGKDKVGIHLCPLGNDIGHPVNESKHPQTVIFKEIVANWSKVVKYVEVSEYYTNFRAPMHLTPNYWMIGRNIQYYASLGVNGYTAEDIMFWTRAPPTRLAQHADFTYFRQYVMSKMMFYPTRPVLYYEDDFLYGYYGASAASYVRRFLNATKELADSHPEAYVGCLAPEIQGYQTNNYNYYAYWLFGKAVEKAKETATEKQIFNIMMAELPSANTVISMEKKMKWPLVIDEEGKIRLQGSKIKECATKILERCKDQYYVDNYTKGVCFVTDSFDTKAEGVYKELKYLRDSNPALIMKSGDLKAISGEKPAYGRIFSFMKGNNEYIDSIEGIDFCMYPTFKIVNHIDYDMKQGTKTDKSISFSFTNNEMKMEKTYTLNDNNLLLKCKFTNTKTSVFQSRPCFSLNLDLGDNSDIFYKLGNGNWERPNIEIVATYVNHFGKQTKSQSTLSICSGKTKKGMKFDFTSSKISFFSVCLNKSSKYVKVYIGTDFVELNSNAVYENSLTMTPLENIQNLPSTAMPNLETPNQIVHFYPLYYLSINFKKWQPMNDDMSFLGISASSISENLLAEVSYLLMLQRNFLKFLESQNMD